MKRINLITAAILVCSQLFAQSNIESVLRSVENNNTYLKALRSEVEANKLENRTDIFLEDPEVGINYLWGSPSQIGNRVDVNVTQTFDFATVSGAKKKVASSKNNLVDWQYRADRMNLLLDAKSCCLELIYYNGLINVIDDYKSVFEHVGDMELKKYEAGEVSRIEYNKSLMNVSYFEAEKVRLIAERQSLLKRLAGLNGGEDVEFDVDYFEDTVLPISFEQWYLSAEEKNPILAYVKEEIKFKESQLSLNKSLSLPKFSAGYMSERVVGENFQGVSFGISIPLWSNTNRVKQSRLAVTAAQDKASDVKNRIYSNYEALYIRAAGLGAAASAYAKVLDEANSTALLYSSLKEGEISSLEYWDGVKLFFEAYEKALSTQKDYQLALAELSAIFL